MNPKILVSWLSSFCFIFCSLQNPDVSHPRPRPVQFTIGSVTKIEDKDNVYRLEIRKQDMTTLPTRPILGSLPAPRGIS